jgi:hypothetical protein
MKNSALVLSLACIFLTSILVYLAPVLPFQGDTKTFLTVSTFLFAIFAGFFIARQNTRSSEIRARISRFDGILSYIYRSLDHFNPEVQEKIGAIIERHYALILEQKMWNYHLVNKSSTLQSIHAALHESLGEESFKTLRTNTLNRIAAALLEAQIARKDMIALYYEKIPRLQWAVIGFLVLVMLLSLATIPSHYLVIESLLKTAFVWAVLSVLLLLRLLNDLKLFEETIGENSAEDILGIIRNTT